MKGIDVNNFVIDKIFKKLDKKNKSGKKPAVIKSEKKKHRKKDYNVENRLQKERKEDHHYENDPTLKLLTNPKELGMLLNNERYLKGPLKIQITL